MRSAAYGAFSAATVLAVLQGAYGTRRWSFRYELLSEANAKVADLDNIVSCSVAQDWLADIKRTATFTIKDDGVINYLSQRIKPYARLHLPPYGATDYAEWPMGVFLLNSPTRHIDTNGLVTRDVKGFDPLQALADDKSDDRTTLLAGTVVTEAVSDLLGDAPKSIHASTATLPADREWDPGTSRLTIINNLLSSINYQSLSFDEDGVALVTAYTSPSDRSPEYVYTTDDRSLLLPEFDQELDLFSIPNKWVLVVSNPDQDLIVSTATNTDPGSPTSTVRRGRTITDFRTEIDAVSQSALDAKVARLAFEASQVYEAITFQTGMNPLHSGNDVLQLEFPPLAIAAKYAEQSWSMDLVAGAPMKHRLRRVVNLAVET